LSTIPTDDRTFDSLPPQPACLVSGFSLNVWNTSMSSPHLAQRYWYVGIGGFLLCAVQRVSPPPPLALSEFEC
jgi:hypothetical protein